MESTGVARVFFSPTGTTRNVVNAVAAGIALPAGGTIDLTLPGTARPAAVPGPGMVTIVAMPVYGGRLPLEGLARLGQCPDGGGPAVVVVVYGNRAYEDALLELADVVRGRGFVPVAAGAFVGEHSFSSAATPIAVGRPDAADLDKATAFGAAVRRKLDGVTSLADLAPLTVPGHVPYRQRSALPPLAPVFREEVCVRCGQCAAVCPTGAITVADKVETRAEACLHCCACVKVCPTGARVVDNPKILEIAQRLATNCAVRREPEVYL